MRGKAEIIPGAAVSAASSVQNAVDEYFANHSDAIVQSIRNRMERIEAEILDGFLKRIQARYVNRIEALEANADRLNETLREIQASDQKTGEDLRRLADGVGGLVEGVANAKSL